MRRPQLKMSLRPLLSHLASQIRELPPIIKIIWPHVPGLKVDNSKHAVVVVLAGVELSLAILLLFLASPNRERTNIIII